MKHLLLFHIITSTQLWFCHIIPVKWISRSLSGVSRPERGALMLYRFTSVTDPTERSNFTSPTGRRLLLYYPEGARKNFSWAGNHQPMRSRHNLANEKPLHFKLEVSFSGLCLTASPNALSSIKKMVLSFVLWIYLQFTIDCMSWTAILCCSWINLFCW